MQSPSKVLEIYGQKFKVDYPTVGQWVEIGMEWNNFSTLRDYSTSTLILKELHTAIQFFRVACPDLIRAINHESINDMSMKEAKPLLMAYVKEISPWIKEWSKEYEDVLDLILETQKELAEISEGPKE